MTTEEVFVHCHILEANDPLSRFELGDDIHQQKRVTVRNNLLYLIGIQEHRPYPEFNITQFDGEREYSTSFLGLYYDISNQ